MISTKKILNYGLSQEDWRNLLIFLNKREEDDEEISYKILSYAISEAGFLKCFSSLFFTKDRKKEEISKFLYEEFTIKYPYSVYMEFYKIIDEVEKSKFTTKINKEKLFEKIDCMHIHKKERGENFLKDVLDFIAIKELIKHKSYNKISLVEFSKGRNRIKRYVKILENLN